MHDWFDENKRYGFYLLGFFDKGRKAGFAIQRERPFEIDEVLGLITAKCFNTIPRNLWAKEWFFFEGHKIKEIDENEDLRVQINDIWDEWCKKYKRKYEAIMTVGFTPSTPNKP